MSELFETNPPENATPVYRRLCRPDEIESYVWKCRHRQVREHCERLWSLFQPYADDHFLTEFQLHTHERWFEMYLTASMLEAQLKVQTHKTGPDVVVEVANRRVWIEATCATAGDQDKPDSVLPLVPDRVPPEPTGQYVLRIRNSLDAKGKKYRQYIREGIVGQRDVTIIAINIFQIYGLDPYMNSHMQRALYGIGDPIITMTRSTREIVGVGHQSETMVQKSSGAEVNVLPFCNGSMPHISAVLMSHADMFNLPDRLGDDLVLYPNLECDNRWVPGKLNIGREWIFESRPEKWIGRVVSCR